MEQLNIPADKRITVDFNAPGIPKEAQILNPVVFQEGDAYCCLLGLDPVNGIFGCEDTPEKAVKDWGEELTRRLQKADPGDEAAQYARDVLGAKKEGVW